jgi:hypothetical protein
VAVTGRLWRILERRRNTSIWRLSCPFTDEAEFVRPLQWRHNKVNPARVLKSLVSYGFRSDLVFAWVKQQVKVKWSVAEGWEVPVVVAELPAGETDGIAKPFGPINPQKTEESALHSFASVWGCNETY